MTRKHPIIPITLSTLCAVLFSITSLLAQNSIRLSKANNTVDRNSHYVIKNKADAEAFARIYNLSELTSLEVKYRDDDMLSNLGSASGLKSLWLKKLDLEYVPDGIYELSELKLLSLQRNPIKILPKGICNCTKLSVLILWDTEIHTFPLCAEDLPLRQVDLYGVQMNAVDQEDLQALLPRTKLELEAPCDCKFDD